MVELHHLGSSTKIDDELDVADEFHKGIDATCVVLLDVALKQVEFLPRFLSHLEVKLLLAANLLELRNFLFVNA